MVVVIETVLEAVTLIGAGWIMCEMHEFLKKERSEEE